MMYAGNFNNKFPPNISAPSPGIWWLDDERVGQYLMVKANSNSGRTVLVCPSDDDSARSYSMNIWASSKTDSYMTTMAPIRGTLLKSGEPHADQIILITENWSSQTVPGGGTWLAPATIGYAGLTPGQRFGAGSGIGGAINTNRFGSSPCELPFYRHRLRRSARVIDPVGRVAIAYVDGHAAIRNDTDLADSATGLSSLDTLWSSLDPSINR
jgi:prepilin-type processing-associated H-X9-DG protein